MIYFMLLGKKREVEVARNWCHVLSAGWTQHYRIP